MDKNPDIVNVEKTEEGIPEEKNKKYKMPDLLTVSPSPHIKGPIKTSGMMADVIIALIPAFIWGVIEFGARAFIITAISVISAVLFEALFQLIAGKKITVGDLSAVVTGLLLGMNLSSDVPIFIPIVGSFFAIVVVKQIFGGIGKNIVNPALAARVFLFAWPSEMGSFTDPGGVDITSYATPLAELKAGSLPKESIFDLMIGNAGGCIGEVSALLLLAGGIYLLCRRVITWHTPVAFIGTVALLTYVFPQIPGENLNFMLAEIFSGGLFIAAIFMATDYATTPITGAGRIIFGVGCGLITVFIRYFGAYPEGVSFSILIMNLLVWYIDRITMPKRFGYRKPQKKSKSEGR